MTNCEAQTVLMLMFGEGDDDADRMISFLFQFPEWAELARETWLERFGQPWEE
jgi:hypothetical protein